jgi:hypothetical protein
MRLLIQKFEPSSQVGEVTFHLPAGSIPINARMSRMGDGELVYTAPEESTAKTEPVTILFLWEDMKNTGGGEHDRWRHIGSWSFNSGGWQHAFAAVTKKARA